MRQPRVLLIIGGGIAAYKSCELVRLLQKQGSDITCVLTNAGEQFVTPMSLAALTGNKVHTGLWDMADEVEIGHIQLSRSADLLVVCPATADLLAKMTAGIADDLATTLLLATDKPVLVVPAMNVRMWQHKATQRNVGWLRDAGIDVMEPDEGEMACGEFGLGRLPEPEVISKHIAAALGSSPLKGQPDFEGGAHRPLYGRHILVTAGPTHEPIDPVRYIANRSSGRQGFAIAGAAARAGARVTLIAGPVVLATPPGVERTDVETALEMQQAVEAALPADAAIMVAAVGDWRAATKAGSKLKKDDESQELSLNLTQNPDILAGLIAGPSRPDLVIGFAAETDNVLDYAKAKRSRKGADWIVANDVSGDVMGGARNAIHIVSEAGIESFEEMPKEQVADALIARIADYFAVQDSRNKNDG